MRILAEAEVAAAKLRTAADETRYAIDAAGKREIYEAENVQSPEVMALRVKLAVVERLEAIIRESGKPLERIEGIKIVQLSGLDPSGGVDGASLSDQVVKSALRYRTQAPMVDALAERPGTACRQPGRTATGSAGAGNGRIGQAAGDLNPNWGTPRRSAARCDVLTSLPVAPPRMGLMELLFILAIEQGGLVVLGAVLDCVARQ